MYLSMEEGPTPAWVYAAGLLLIVVAVAFSFTVIGVGVLSSLRPDGWRLTAWVAGVLPAALGIASLVYPDVDSSLSSAWSVAAIVWGLAFVARAGVAARRGALDLSA